MHKNLNILKFIIPFFVIWRLALLYITFLGLSFFPYFIKNSGPPIGPSSGAEFWIRWANWDGGHFLGIATAGYQPFQSVFLPLYPLVIKTLNLVGIEYFWGGFLISHISALVFLWFLYKLTTIEFDESIAKKTVLVALLFPTSFYLGTLYSESLFLALATASFYFAKKDRWLLAITLAGLSFITKIPGIAVITAIMAMYYLKDSSPIKLKVVLKNRLFQYIGCLFLLLIFLYLLFPGIKTLQLWSILGVLTILTTILSWIIFGLILLFTIWKLWQNLNLKRLFQPLTVLFFLQAVLPILFYIYYQTTITQRNDVFLNSYSKWHLQPTLPWEVIKNYIDQLLHSGIFTPGFMGKQLNDFLFFIGLLGLFLISLQKLKLYYSIYFFIAMIITPISGTLVGTPRHALAIFPMFILLAQIQNNYLRFLGMIFSVLLLALFSIAYINGYWVA